MPRKPIEYDAPPPAELTRSHQWRAFSGATVDEALALFAKRYPQFHETAPLLLWVRSNKTLYVAMDVARLL